MFNKQKFTSHAGLSLNWKIECDDLTQEDYEVLAFIVSERFDFFSVFGIPRGGIKFASALEKYKTPTSNTLLIADDVYTTGKSMVDTKLFLDYDEVIGVPIFSRTKPKQNWVYPIFQLWSFD